MQFYITEHKSYNCIVFRTFNACILHERQRKHRNISFLLNISLWKKERKTNIAAEIDWTALFSNTK